MLSLEVVTANILIFLNLRKTVYLLFGIGISKPTSAPTPSVRNNVIFLTYNLAQVSNLKFEMIYSQTLSLFIFLQISRLHQTELL